MESLRARYEEFDSQFGRHLVNEKLDISIQEGRLLSSIRQLETEDPQPNWHAMLPPLRRVSSLRGEPLLETQDEEERDRHLGGSDAVELLDENTSPFQDEESTLMDLDNPEKKVEMTADNSRFSRESSIQLAQNRPDEGSFQKAAASFVESVMTISKVIFIVHHRHCLNTKSYRENRLC